MSRRRAIQYPALTSMLDVLFILVFAALIQAAALEQARSEESRAAIAALSRPATAIAPAVAAAPARPAAVELLRARALDQLDADLRARETVVARVTADGTLRALEARGETTVLGLPLVERVADPDKVLAYLGDRSADLRLCAMIALRLGVADLAGAMVVIAPEDLRVARHVALAAGLQRDVERCLADQRGLAVIVEPTPEAP